MAYFKPLNRTIMFDRSDKSINLLSISVWAAVFSSSSISDRHVKPFLSAALFPEANFHIDTDASIANVADGLGELLGNEGRAYGSASGKSSALVLFYDIK